MSKIEEVAPLSSKHCTFQQKTMVTVAILEGTEIVLGIWRAAFQYGHHHCHGLTELVYNVSNNYKLEAYHSGCGISLFPALKSAGQPCMCST